MPNARRLRYSKKQNFPTEYIKKADLTMQQSIYNDILTKNIWLMKCNDETGKRASDKENKWLLGQCLCLRSILFESFYNIVTVDEMGWTG